MENQLMKIYFVNLFLTEDILKILVITVLFTILSVT